VARTDVSREIEEVVVSKGCTDVTSGGWEVLLAVAESGTFMAGDEDLVGWVIEDDDVLVVAQCEDHSSYHWQTVYKSVRIECMI
jgi:hypothetical protein